MPFLPGDSLLFAAGTFCAGVQNDVGKTAELNLWLILLIMAVAAVGGDSLNYFLGKKVGLKVLGWHIGGKQMVSEKHIDKTRDFYDKHGSKTIILARFVPIVRTFAPFVAGIGDMHYGKFHSLQCYRRNRLGALIGVGGLFLRKPSLREEQFRNCDSYHHRNLPASYSYRIYPKQKEVEERELKRVNLSQKKRLF